MFDNHRKIKVSSWYGWMGNAISFVFGNKPKLEIIVGTHWQDFDYLSEAGWTSISFAFFSIQWDEVEPLYF